MIDAVQSPEDEGVLLSVSDLRIAAILLGEQAVANRVDGKLPDGYKQHAVAGFLRDMDRFNEQTARELTRRLCTELAVGEAQRREVGTSLVSANQIRMAAIRAADLVDESTQGRTIETLQACSREALIELGIPLSPEEETLHATQVLSVLQRTTKYRVKQTTNGNDHHGTKQATVPFAVASEQLMSIDLSQEESDLQEGLVKVRQSILQTGKDVSADLVIATCREVLEADATDADDITHIARALLTALNMRLRFGRLKQLHPDRELTPPKPRDYTVPNDGSDYADAFVAPVEDWASLGIHPELPTQARPGSEQKVMILSARYSAGLPLWHPDDSVEHGPEESSLQGQPTPEAHFDESEISEFDDEDGDDEEPVF